MNAPRNDSRGDYRSRPFTPGDDAFHYIRLTTIAAELSKQPEKPKALKLLSRITQLPRESNLPLAERIKFHTLMSEAYAFIGENDLAMTVIEKVLPFSNRYRTKKIPSES